MSLTDLLGIELPIVQAPMAGVQGSALAVAVSNAGGLGSLPCALLGTDDLRRELTKLREQTSKPFALNFFSHRQPVADSARELRWRALLAPYYEELGIDLQSASRAPARTPFTEETAELVSEFTPRVVSFHFGLPSPELLEAVKSRGSTVLSTATTVAEALWLEANGADVIIAQGLEAGGHRGMFQPDNLPQQMGTFALLPQVVRAVKIPVIAAGGIADAATAAAAMKLGASGIQAGTAYLLCPEASTSAMHRAALKEARAGRTELTNLFSGGLARGIPNRLMQELGPVRPEAPAFPLASAALAPLRAAAERAGRGDFSPLWAGQNVTGCRDVAGGRITRELAGA